MLGSARDPLPWPFVARSRRGHSRCATAARAPPVPRAPGRVEAALTHREEWARLSRCPHGRSTAPAFVYLLCLPRALAAAAARPLGSRPGTPSAAGEGARAGSALGRARPGAGPRPGAAESAPRHPSLVPSSCSRPLPPARPLPLPPSPAQPGHILLPPAHLSARSPLHSSALGCARLPQALGPSPLGVRPAGRTGKAWPWPAPGPALPPHLAARLDKGGLPGALRGGARRGLRLEVRMLLSSLPCGPLDPSVRPSAPRLLAAPPPCSWLRSWPLRPPAFRRTLTFPRSDTASRAPSLPSLGRGSRPLSSALACSLWDMVSLCLSVSESPGGLSDRGPVCHRLKKLRRLAEPRAKLAGVPSAPFQAAQGVRVYCGGRKVLGSPPPPPPPASDAGGLAPSHSRPVLSPSNPDGGAGLTLLAPAQPLPPHCRLFSNRCTAVSDACES